MAKNSFCQLCALESDTYVDLLDQQEINLKLVERIKQCFQNLLVPVHFLPNTICFNCCDKVKEYSNFFASYSQSQTLLMEVLINNTMASNSEEMPGTLPDTNLTVNEENQKNSANNPIDTGKIVNKASEVKESQRNIVETAVEDDDEISNDSGWFNDYFEARTPVNTRKMMEGYVWKCISCEKELSSLSSFKLHYYQEHKEPPSFKCMNCEKVYTRYRSFVRHVKIHWNQECFRCNICGKDFSQKSILQSHMTSHSEERPFVCSECGKAFKQYSSLYLHTKSHLPDEVKPKFHCNICTKVFCSKHATKTHMKIHTGEKNFICDICGKRFIAKRSLDYHIKTHDEIKPHSCKTCNKSFMTPRLLAKHTMLHTGQKPYQCDVCGKQFRERSALKEHSRIHTGDMPYSCEFCGKLFRFKGILTVHRRIHTGERPYQCGVCRREFTNWANYNKHLKRRHKPGSEGESDSEITAGVNQQQLQPTQLLPQQQEIPNTSDIQQEIMNTTISTAPAVQDVFTLEPTLYDNLSLELPEPLTDLYRLPPSYSVLPSCPPVHPPSTSSTSPLQLYYLQRYIKYPDFLPTVSSALTENLFQEESVPRPR
ncbi:hypothetical protein O3M35_010729 [Rhynocoris fuscipes]|uniref:Uncharacterized protein n=1 Tax=Rhynocoris fuscipes TaxID=488301 RepID=A0AAW1D375_9HEMI